MKKLFRQIGLLFDPMMRQVYPTRLIRVLHAGKEVGRIVIAKRGVFEEILAQVKHFNDDDEWQSATSEPFSSEENAIAWAEDYLYDLSKIDRGTGFRKGTPGVLFVEEEIWW